MCGFSLGLLGHRGPRPKAIQGDGEETLGHVVVCPLGPLVLIITYQWGLGEEDRHLSRCLLAATSLASTLAGIHYPRNFLPGSFALSSFLWQR